MGRTALLSALTLQLHPNELTVLKALVQHPDTDVNLSSAGNTPLIDSAGSMDEKATQILLGHPNIRPNDVNQAGETALLVAAKRGSEDIVRQLCDHPKTEVNFCIARDGITALMAAAQSGHEKVIAALLRRSDLKLGLRNHDGRTALELAAAAGHEWVVRQLEAVSHP